MSSDTSLVLTDVSVAYGHVTVLSQLNLSLETGRLHVLLGPNGAGKSTLLKAIAGIAKLSGGSIQFEGAELNALAPIPRALRVAYVPQKQEISLPLTVLDALQAAAYARRHSGVDTFRISTDVANAMATFGLEKLRDAEVSRLSGGEWRKVMLAQALVQLAHAPGLLLLDEPSAFLDPPAVWETVRIVTNLARLGYTVLMAMHELHFARACAENVVLLKEGRVFDAGSPAECLTLDRLSELYSCPPADLEVALS